MAEPSHDVLRRVLAQILSLRKNLPQEPEESDAVRFHEQLDRLRAAGYEVEEFRLTRQRDMFRRWKGSSDWGPDAVHVYAEDFTIQPGVLEAKMDALLTYFEWDREGKPVRFRL
ncbi:MAG: hypothetical protein U0Z70_03810 [Thermomicrobiales bacterium]